MNAGRTLGRLVAIIAVAAAFASAPRVARADRVGELAQLLSSSSEKTRISAVVSLARLGGKPTLKPLVLALHDPSAQVRALAAAALGKLGHKAALPLLRSAATDDTDATVRKHARIAAISVAKANNLPDELPAEARAPTKVARHGSGFGRSPHAVADAPDLYVVVKTSSDDSPGKADKDSRKVHADVVKQALLESFRTAPQVTMVEAEAQRWALDPRMIDLSVVKLEVVQAEGMIEVNAELRLAISDETGKMLSFLSGGAKIQVPQGKFDMRYLPNMRKEALESAMRGMFEKLLAHLRETSQS
ncbi:MAG TPA: HEAT repeat domain-containing protein [Kofleriaceae bacterium]|nr:HEAT repeat domain-containing protein [Kofleriaceae bacterium]